MKTRLFALLLCAALLMGCGGSYGAETPGPTEAAEDQPAAAPSEAPAAESYDGLVFSATDREGNTWDESVFAAHRLTMLNFWEPWCGPCVGEMADLQKLQDTYADRGFLILGIYSTEGVESDVDEVLAYTGVTYPILHYTDAFDRFQSGYVPTTVFVDGDGHVIGGDSALYVGSNSFEGWAAIVEGML